MRPIDSQEVQGMVSHWIGCPVNGYLGSGYGSDIPALLQKPLSTKDADLLLKKLRFDVPLIASAPPGSVNVYSATRDIDKLDILIEVAGEIVSSQELER